LNDAFIGLEFIGGALIGGTAIDAGLTGLPVVVGKLDP
jgi:hypothetical protein